MSSLYAPLILLRSVQKNMSPYALEPGFSLQIDLPRRLDAQKMHTRAKFSPYEKKSGDRALLLRTII